jgi:hypothetical protein
MSIDRGRETAAVDGDEAASESARAGFLMRWVMPVLFVAVTVGVFWFVGRMSMPMLEADSEIPEGHFSAGCMFCHRVAEGVDPAALPEQEPEAEQAPESEQAP